MSDDLARRRWIDRQFETMAGDAGAEVLEVPALISGETLERAGYFEAFGGDPHRDPMPAPALCYHAYARLANRRLDRPVVLTCVGTCVRRERDHPPSRSRLWEFTMREVIVVGTSDWVRAEREAWIARVVTFAKSIGLAGEMRLATDPFFAGPAQGKKLMQQLKELKYELLMPVGEAEPAAVASFNLHESFFGSRFGITAADGSCAHSGCVAFGIERWTLALMSR